MKKINLLQVKDIQPGMRVPGGGEVISCRLWHPGNYRYEAQYRLVIEYQTHTVEHDCHASQKWETIPD